MSKPKSFGGGLPTKPAKHAGGRPLDEVRKHFSCKDESINECTFCHEDVRNKTADMKVHLATACLGDIPENLRNKYRKMLAPKAGPPLIENGSK